MQTLEDVTPPGLVGHACVRHPNWPDWLIDVRVDIGPYGPRIVSLTVTPFTVDTDGEVRPSDDPNDASPGGIPRRLLGAISTPQLVEIAQRNAGHHPGFLLAGAELPDDVEALASASQRRRPARNTRGDAFYAKLAKDYEDLIDAGVTKPTKVLAESMNLDAGTVRNLFVEVRRKKFLTKPGPGQAGGRVTPEALQILAKLEADV